MTAAPITAAIGEAEMRHARERSWEALIEPARQIAQARGYTVTGERLAAWFRDERLKPVSVVFRVRVAGGTATTDRRGVLGTDDDYQAGFVRADRYPVAAGPRTSPDLWAQVEPEGQCTLDGVAVHIEGYTPGDGRLMPGERDPEGLVPDDLAVLSRRRARPTEARPAASAVEAQRAAWLALVARARQDLAACTDELLALDLAHAPSDDRLYTLFLELRRYQREARALPKHEAGGRSSSPTPHLAADPPASPPTRRPASDRLALSLPRGDRE